MQSVATSPALPHSVAEDQVVGKTSAEILTPIHLHHLYGADADRRYGLDPGNRDLFHQRCPVITHGNVAEKVEEIRHYVHNTMELYEHIFDSMEAEQSFYVPPVHKLRHPMIFYYGHTASFYVNKLCVAGLLDHINPVMEEMFAVGVDEMSWDDLNEGHYKWPKVQDVCEYRRTVRDTIDKMMTSGEYPLQLPLTFDNSTENKSNSFWWIMLMGAEHERIHIETASVHLRELPLQHVRQSMSSFWKRCPTGSTTSAPENFLVPIAGGEVRVGRKFDDDLYGWDSDYSGNTSLVKVAPFKASKFLVSNKEFMNFIEEGGYTCQAYWDEEGWQWVSWKKPKHPWFWVEDATRPNGFSLRLQTEVIDLPLDWPVELNNFEAFAFCQYLSQKHHTHIRLPTEAEWLLLFDRFITDDQHHWKKGKAPGNINMENFCSSAPVNMFQHKDLYDVIGNVWQHTSDKVYPYPNYRVHPFYDDFSRPTFDNLHTCMKGGCWVSTGNEATRDARFAFRRHFFQFIGCRYIEGEPVKERTVSKMVGVDAEVDSITDYHFRKTWETPDDGILGIAQFAKASFEAFGKVPPHRMMDLLCGAGRVSYELSSTFKEVIGVDFSARRLIPAFSLRERGECEYLTHHGIPGKEEVHKVRSEEFPWHSSREKVTFFQSDPVNLHKHLENFSMIVCWNCLENSYQPSGVPGHLFTRLLSGGLLVLGIAKEFREHWNCIAGENFNDPLMGGQGKKALHDVLFDLLGGVKVVERLGTSKVFRVPFWDSGKGTQTREVEFCVYRKC